MPFLLYIADQYDRVCDKNADGEPKAKPLSVRILNSTSSLVSLVIAYAVALL